MRLLQACWSCLVGDTDVEAEPRKHHSFTLPIGITTATTSNVSSTCTVLARVAGRRDCQPALTLLVSSRRYKCLSATAKSAVLLTMTVNMPCIYQCISIHCAA